MLAQRKEGDQCSDEGQDIFPDSRHNIASSFVFPKKKAAKFMSQGRRMKYTFIGISEEIKGDTGCEHSSSEY